MSALMEFWKRMDGNVHPDDRSVFEQWQADHGKLPVVIDHPPPAFWGDVENAPVLVLEANGGYVPGMTEGEYQDAIAVKRHLDYLRRGGPVRPGDFSEYYAKNRLNEPIARGSVAWVNALPYRSPNLTDPAVARLAELLPCVQVARRWLRNEILPLAREGRRLVVFHRWSLWGFKRYQMQSECILYSSTPAFDHLGPAAYAAIDRFLTNHERSE